MKENQQILETLIKNPYKPWDEKIDDLNIIIIKEPDNPEKALANLREHRPTKELVIVGDNETPACSYHYNQINSMEMIKDALHDTIERNKRIPNLVAFKIKPTFSILLEYHSKSPGHGASLGIQGDYVKYVLSLGEAAKGHFRSFTFRISNAIKLADEYFRVIHVEIQKMLEHIADASSTMYIGISDISFHVSRIGKVGSLPSEFEKY
jgi:hypothetical protein